MSRRLATVLRVAELREGIARGQLGRAAQAEAEAGRHAETCREALAATTVRGGTVADLVSSQETLGRGAQQVGDADLDVEAARAAREQALAEWTEHRRHHRLVDELVERQRSDVEQARDRAQQRLADDLAGQRSSQDAP